MHVGINAHLLNRSNTYRAAGVSYYIDRLLQGLNAVDSDTRYTVFMGNWARSRAEAIPALGENFDLRFSHVPTQCAPVRILWEQTVQPWCARNLDVLHCPVNVVPMVSRVPSVVTMHDLTFLINPNWHSPTRSSYLRLMTRLSAHRARFIITDSENTRQDVIRLLKMAPEKVVTVPIAAGPEYRWLGQSKENAQEIARFRESKGLPPHFFLYVGTLEPRKNIPSLLRAYAEFRRKAAGPGCDLPKLVIAGGKGWMYDEIFLLVQALDLDQDVIFPGFLPQEEIVWWYNAAMVFIYLSSYEGFGLPPLQAMACGVPVIASNNSSLPEVVGQAGLLVDPKDTAAITAALEKVVACPDLRDDLRERGLKQSTLFSWQRTAEQTLQVLRAAARTSG